MKKLILLLSLLTSTVLAQNLNTEAKALVQKADVLFLGESHRNELDHQRQLLFLQELARLQDRPVLVVAEMFTTLADRDLENWNQTATLQEFPLELWKREWGHPYSLYQPIWTWAHQNQVPVLSLRPDPELTKILKGKGPSAVVEKIGEILIGPRSYRQHMAEIVAMHYPPEQTPEEEMVDQFFTVQCFWDEFMAWRIKEIRKQFPRHRLAVLVGHGHLHPGHGIGWRLQRRMPQTNSLNVLFDDQQKAIAELLYIPETR